MTMILTAFRHYARSCPEPTSTTLVARPWPCSGPAAISGSCRGPARHAGDPRSVGVEERLVPTAHPAFIGCQQQPSSPAISLAWRPLPA